MEQAFKKRIAQIREENLVHVCDRIQGYYTQFVVGGALIAMTGGTREPPSHYTIALGTAIIGIPVLTGFYTFVKRLSRDEHIPHVDEVSAPYGDVVMIRRPAKYPTLEE
jgi:hypothetical protein